MTDRQYAATEEEWRAFCMIGDIREIASPRFVRLINLAHAEGLLPLMLSDDLAAVAIRASELIATLSGLICSEYSLARTRNPMSEEDRSLDFASSFTRRTNSYGFVAIGVPF